MKIIFYANIGINNQLEVDEDVDKTEWEDMTDKDKREMLFDILNSAGLEIGWYEKETT